MMIIQQLCLSSNRGQQILLEDLRKVVVRNYRKEITEDQIEAMFSTDDEIKVVDKKGKRSAYLLPNVGRQTTQQIRKRANTMLKAVANGLPEIHHPTNKDNGPSLGETLRQVREKNEEEQHAELEKEIQKITDEELTTNMTQTTQRIPKNILKRIIANKRIKERRHEENTIKILTNTTPSTLQLAILKIINNRPNKPAYTLEYIRDHLKDAGYYPTIQPARETVICSILKICTQCPDTLSYRPVGDSIVIYFIGKRKRLFSIINEENFRSNQELDN